MDEPSKSSSKSKSSSSSKSRKEDKSQISTDFLRKKLLEHFKHPDFKSNLQKDAIKEIIRGNHDVYVSMPTGSGKSLCYQLPGMLHENKITIVFSPLIALIKDQMDHLTKLKICAESLNSKMTLKERERVIIDLRSIKPSTKFLYITPEQAATDFFRSLLDSIVKYNKLALVAVDECHCVSEMGHQFRRDYLKLGELRQRYPTVRWIALTATASKDVTSDVFKQLRLKEPKSFKTPCFRKNLFYDIIYKNSIQDDYIHLKQFALKCLKSKIEDVKPSNAPCGIIYCRTRDSVERVAIGLSKQNIAARPYHAGLNDRDRKQYQEDWMNGIFPVICATNSFGMGVDKATVRFVVHWDVPQNIAAYYQESGRAGRDGKQSYCRLYYCRQEVKSIGFLLNQQLQKTPDCVKAKRSVKEFDKLTDHCEALRCRHLLFSAYFGDQAPDCKKRQLCDVCKDHKNSEKKLETFHKLTHSSYASKMDVDFDTSDLYEGGRNAVHQAESQYNDDDYSESSTSSRDSKAKKDTTNLIQKEFERRKQKIELAKKLEQTQTRASGIRIKSSIHTDKMSGLNVKKRESYVDFLLKSLMGNAEKASEKPSTNLKACDFEDIAADLEYNCFTKNRVLAMYTRAITVERLRIDRSTKNAELLPEIKNHVPKKRTAHGGTSEAMQNDLNDFMKKHKISDKNNATTPSKTNTTTSTNVGFQTARVINNKLKEPNRMKKDPLTQMSINSFFSTAAIKREPEDNDENEAENVQNAKRRKVDGNESVRIKTEPMDTNEVDQQVNVKQEPDDCDSDAHTEDGESDNEMDTQIGAQANGSCPNEPRNGDAQTNHDNHNSVCNVKMEQESDNDTDTPSDDEDASTTAKDNTHSDQTPGNLIENIKTEPEEYSYVPPTYVKTNFEPKPHQEQSSTLNSIYDSFPSTSSNYMQFPEAPSAAIYHTRPSANLKEKLVEVRTKSKPVNTADGQQLVRFNHLESPVNSDEASQNNSTEVQNTQETPNEQYDEDVLDDLEEDIESYVNNLEKKIDDELETLKGIKIDGLSMEELLDARKRLAQIQRKKANIMVHKNRENVKKSEEEKERLRDKFLHELYGLNFDYITLEQKLSIEDTQRHPQPSTNDIEERKENIRYNEFMKKPKIEPDSHKTMKEHFLSMERDSYVNKMHSENKIDAVPQRIIDSVKKDKTMIKSKVDKYLMPYYKSRQINREIYSVICEKITKLHYQTNDYDSKSIKTRVDKMVKSVLKQGVKPNKMEQP